MADKKLQGDNLFGNSFWEAVDQAIKEGLDYQSYLAELPELLKEVITRPLSGDDVEYLQKIHAYLAITNPERPMFEPEGEAAIWRSTSGWLIYDYGNYIVTSSGIFAYGYHPDSLKQKAINDLPDDDKGGRRRKIDYNQTGTITQQIVDTSRDVLTLAQQRWPSAQMVEGYPNMRRMAWVIATLNDFTIEGFNPSVEDRVVLEWARRNGADRLISKDTKHLRDRRPKQRRPGR